MNFPSFPFQIHSAPSIITDPPYDRPYSPTRFYYLIWVDFSVPQITVYEGSRTVLTSSELIGGMSSHPTSIGDFTVYSVEANHHSQTYNAEMPYSVFYYNGEAFHQGSVSSHSHGCIHLRHSFAQSLYRWARPIWKRSKRHKHPGPRIHVHIQ